MTGSKIFLDSNIIIDVFSGNNELADKINALDLYKKGKPIATNDVWIAATVKQYGLTLISRDNHFKEIDNILTEAW